MNAPVLLCDLSLAPAMTLALTRDGDRPEYIRRFSCPDRDAFEDAIRGYIAKAMSGPPAAVAMSARGWQDRERLHLQGVGFELSRGDIRTLAEVQRVNFLNNFVARALAVPRLARTEREPIVGGQINDDNVIAVLGPHFGLGLAALVSDGVGGWTALHGEGGHSDLPVKGEKEWRIAEAMRARTGYVSRETGISVAGLSDIWHVLHAVANETPQPLSAAEIISAAHVGAPRAVETIDIMTGWLAAMASDIVLIMGANGVYLTGALLDMIGRLFNQEIFRARYLDKGPRTEYVSTVPVFRTQASDMELTGLATLFE